MTMTPTRRLQGAAFTAFVVVTLPLATAAEPDPFDDDSLWGAPHVESNRGDLNFLAAPPEGRVHHHQNQITLVASSLNDGWVTLRQCHNDIDRVRRAQILYNAATTRDIEIESQSNIGESWVEGASVQLRQVEPEAELCVRARSQMLRILDDQSYVLENGPFMRRYLDGYFPMRVTVSVDWGDLGLSLADITPEAQPGFEITKSRDGLVIETTFEGRLKTELRLVNGERP